MLYLVGMGISDEHDLSMRALDTLMKCKTVYCEMFTSIWHGNLKNLEKIIQKPIILISREQVESDFLIKEAKKSVVALLVPGDPLTATTHIELMIEAKKNSVLFDVVHSSSIYTAVAETGLQIYKFGRTTTFPKPQENFNPSSPIEVIRENEKSNLHTLVLLDIGMSATEGLKILNESGYSKKKVVACCKLGTDEKTIKFGTVGSMVNDKDLNKTPAVLVVPGNIHFKEEEALAIWS